MKVKELKELIEGMDDNGEVIVNMTDGCCGDLFMMEVIDLDQFSAKYAVIYLAAAPGYRSCIQASNTKKADKEYWDKFGPKV